ncbi:MAG: c-type cytochrome [Chloroflexi bacterium]|nr:c-type cytochrome [Chloroflexota bacterium]
MGKYRTQLILSFGFAIFILLSSVGLVLAGGWSVVTLDQIPQKMIAGEPQTISFMVRQHGRTPMQNITPRISATQRSGAKLVEVTAQPKGEIGHYVATLILPDPGEWKWTINAFGFVQPMPNLQVLQSADSASATVSSSQGDGQPAQDKSSIPAALPIVIGILGFMAAAGALFLWVRTQSQFASVLTLFAFIVIGSLGFASLSWLGMSLRGETVPAIAGSVQEVSAPDAGIGKALFLAKGCVMCHQHEAVKAERREFADFHVGPDLTNITSDPAYLRRWLQDPSGVKPDTMMPALGLRDEEIGALIDFLTISH